MGLTTATIKVESRLEEMFCDLPKVVSLSEQSTHSVVFGYGDKKELNFFLKTKTKKDAYPLIWLLYPYKETHTPTKVEVSNATFILAVPTVTGMQNKERLSRTFGEILIPLFDNFRTLFKRANIVNCNSEYDVFKYPNYSDSESGDEHAGAFIWDAMRIDFDFDLIEGCYRKITFR